MNKLLDEEEKEFQKGSRGAKEKLIINTRITSGAKISKRCLYTAYIDYQKVFDNIPLSWYLDVLKIYGIEQQIITFLKRIMAQWKTHLLIRA